MLHKRFAGKIFMRVNETKKLDGQRIRSFYNSVSDVWAIDDPWHDYSKRVISSYLSKQTFFDNTIVLNAGSAGNTYNIDCQKMYHIDIAEEKLKNIDNAFVASIEKTPFENNFFDIIVCVGSVLNYCDAFNSISELSRILKLKGYLVIEFESSCGFEYLGKECYKKGAEIITTEYIEKQHKQWLYSRKYIMRILRMYKLKIIEEYPFHIIDGLLSKKINENMSVDWSEKTDKLLRHMPYFKNHGNNIIFCCKKIGS